MNNFVWTKQQPMTQPPARRGHVMALDNISKAVIVFGGSGAAGILDDTWIWDGETWHTHTQSVRPPARAFATLAQDPTRGGLVMFGGTGASGTTLSDTWIWDGSAWQGASPTSSPPGRSGAAAASDLTNGAVLVFGGTFGDRRAKFLNDTWLWTTGSWVAASKKTAPPARAYASLVADRRTKQSILFGGGNGSYLDDSWVWDGRSWFQQPGAPGLQARQGRSAIYDEVHAVTVLFGGFGEQRLNDGKRVPAAFADTWSFKEAVWTHYETPAAPPAGMWSVMAQDPKSSGVVLLTDTGGKSFGNSETWTGALA
jgi:hypothetical protein